MKIKVVYVKEPSGPWYSVYAPELPGAFSSGKDLDQARAMIQDAASLTLDCARETLKEIVAGRAAHHETFELDRR